MLKLLLRISIIFVLVFTGSCRSENTPVVVPSSNIQVEARDPDVEPAEPVKKVEKLTTQEITASQLKHIDLNALNRDYNEINNSQIQHARAHLPSVVVMVIDTLRADYVTPSNAPVITEFLEEPEVTHFTQSRGAATSTAHSLFGFFFSILPHLRYQLIDNEYLNLFNHGLSVNRDYLQGSPFLLMLKKIGFKIESFGREDTEFCVDQSSVFESDQKVFLQLNYSKNMEHFFDYCETFAHHSLKASGFNSSYSDNFAVSRFLDRFEHRQPHDLFFSLIRLSGVHHPYGWLKNRDVSTDYKLQTHFSGWRIPSGLGYFAGEKERTKRSP